MQCGGIEWSEKSNGADLRRDASGETRVSGRRVLSDQVDLCVCEARDFKLATLFFDISLSHRLQLRRFLSPRSENFFSRVGNIDDELMESLFDWFAK